ncbi:Rab-like protein 6 [Podila verticillata]|nr:Rab-like protein 6 [Podila verticillata]KFH71311.1 hypothetical protein MVEG_01611 [Podila verticillata NRRL 6337]
MFKLWPFSSGQQNGAAPLDPQDHGVSTKVKPIHASFNKGIPLNMKIIIRGDIRAGKTSVFERLQGHPFRHDHEYMTTEQIQVANIPWQYAHTKDIIKVEVWDVVDKGVQSGELRTSTSNATLKIDNTPASPKAKATQGTDTAPHAAFALDASTIDVYRNTDGVILVYDVSKPWTFEYVAKTLAEVPTNIPVLILSNFTDDGNRSAVDNDKLEELMEEHNAERFKLPCAPANLVRHLDTSMKTGLGLKEIHESFGIPFLNVLRETHRKQFDQKTLEIAELLKALDTHEQERTKASQQSRAPISAKDTTPTKKQPPLPAAIQTSHVVVTPILQTSSPISPARKIRNEHINVDILSPTPHSAQNPAVLFEFNSGKLEEDFFHSVDLDAPNPSVPTVTTGLAISAIELESEQENPLVAGDEDIAESSSRDEDEDEDDSVLQSAHSIWTPGQVEKELLERHMVKSVEETHLEEIEEQEEEEDEEDRDEGIDYNKFGNGAHEEVDASNRSTFESISPLGLRLQQDSDVESHHDYPVASAMYYEHEPSGFVEEPALAIEQKPASLSSYQEIGDGDDQRSNPWGSTGNLLEGVQGPKDTDATNEDDVKDVNEDASSSSFTSAPEELTSVNGRKKDVEIKVLSTLEAEDVEEPSPMSISSENSAEVDGEDQPGDAEDEGSPDPGQGGSTEGEKKKKKKNKKKGKKGK